MIAKIQKWGNSQGLRVSKDLLEQVHMDVGDAVDIKVQKGAILIRPLKVLRGKVTLKELIAQMPKNYKQEKEVWGGPMGEEVW